MCSENKELQRDFLDYLCSVQRSETTIEAYSSDLDIFMVWNLENNGNKPFPELKKRDIVKYQNWLLHENGNSPRRVKRLKSVLSSLSNYISDILDDEYPDFVSIIRKVPDPINVPVREKTVLSDEQLTEILATLVERKQYEKACCLALAMASGARKSELARFKVSFFVPDAIVNGCLYKTPPIKTKGRGNGKFISKYVLVNVFQKYLDLWMGERKRLGIDSEWLFVSKTEDGWGQIKIERMNSWADSISKLSGIDFYWHCVRHYALTALLRSGIPESAATSYFGWANSAMCETYDDRDADEQFSQYFTADGIQQNNESLLAGC